MSKDYFFRYKANLLKSVLIGIDNFATYCTLKKPFLGPLYVGWNVTFRCNCRCDFCKTWEFYDKDNELNTEECIKVMRAIGKAGVSLLSITGGEPLLRNDLFYIIREGKKRGISINLLTNGSLLEEKAEMLIESGLDVVIVSIDSLSSREHDSVRKHPGLLKKAKRGISKLQKVRKNSKPRIIIGAVLSRKNYGHLEEFVDYWKDEADGIVFQPIQENTSTSIFQVSDKKLFFDKKDKEKFKKTYINSLEKYDFFGSGYEKEFINFFFNKPVLKKKYRCFAGFFILQIGANGNVYPCPEFVECLGNLRNKSFLDIWRGENIQNFRKKIRARKYNCFCWYRCTGALNYYLTKLTNIVFFNKK